MPQTRVHVEIRPMIDAPEIETWDGTTRYFYMLGYSVNDWRYSYWMDCTVIDTLLSDHPKRMSKSNFYSLSNRGHRQIHMIVVGTQPERSMPINCLQRPMIELYGVCQCALLDAE